MTAVKGTSSSPVSLINKLIGARNVTLKANYMRITDISSAEKALINVKELPKGTYIVSIVTPQGIVNKRFVKE